MVSVEFLHLIAKSNLSSPADMWNELKHNFERPSLSNKLQLLTRLLDVKMESNGSIDEYFKSMQNLTERLAALSLPVN